MVAVDVFGLNDDLCILGEVDVFFGSTDLIFAYPAIYLQTVLETRNPGSRFN